jgi:predicted nucleic acid-binding protein
MIVFFDTSALVKLYHEEKGSDVLTKFISEHRGVLASIVSDVARIEIRSALWKKVRMHDADMDKTKYALAMFD